MMQLKIEDIVYFPFEIVGKIEKLCTGYIRAVEEKTQITL